MSDEYYNGFDQLPNTVVVIVMAHGEEANKIRGLRPPRAGVSAERTSIEAGSRPILKFNGAILNKYTVVPRGKLAVFQSRGAFELQKAALQHCITEFTQYPLSLQEHGTPLESFNRYMQARGKYIYLQSFYNTFGWVLPSLYGLETNETRRRNAHSFFKFLETGPFDWVLPALHATQPNLSPEEQYKNKQIIEEMGMFELNGVYFQVYKDKPYSMSTLQDKKFVYTGEISSEMDDEGSFTPRGFLKEVEDGLGNITDDMEEDMEDGHYASEEEFNAAIKKAQEAEFQRILTEYQNIFTIEVIWSNTPGIQPGIIPWTQPGLFKHATDTTIDNYDKDVLSYGTLSELYNGLQRFGAQNIILIDVGCDEVTNRASGAVRGGKNKKNKRVSKTKNGKKQKQSKKQLKKSLKKNIRRIKINRKTKRKL